MQRPMAHIYVLRQHRCHWRLAARVINVNVASPQAQVIADPLCQVSMLVYRISGQAAELASGWRQRCMHVPEQQLNTACV